MARNWQRREFLQVSGAAAAGGLALGGLRADARGEPPAPTRPIAANDHIQIALIGAGGQGQYDTGVALEVPGVKLVATSDCYQNRRERTQEKWGKQIFTTPDYREVLARPDIDAVIIATPDHWHKQAAIDAMNAGKDVYLEKPMIHHYADGPEIIAAAQRTGRILQVGSQRVSSMIYRKAKELLEAGAIGELNMITAWWDRNSDVGAWEYWVAPDASPATIEWTRWLGTAPRIPFNADHFFRWRCWQAYGSGVAGDLFVHLFSGVHFVTSVHGPTRAMATGGLRYWKDGRDVPDVLVGLLDYPQGFNLAIHVNFVDGGEENGGITFTGSEGTMAIGGGDSVTLTRVPRRPSVDYTIDSLTEATQKRMMANFRREHPLTHPTGDPAARVERFVAPAGYSDSYDHLANFFSAVRSRQPVVEDPVFGFRAAGAALLANVSYARGQVVHWDPERMVLEGGEA